MQSVTQTLTATYDAQPSSVTVARAALAEFATGAGATPVEVDAVRLAVSEAVTNAVLHAYRESPGPIHVTAALTGRELWILVADEGGGLRPAADRPGLGLGLGLISQVCDEMAIVPRSSGGTEVRIRFALGIAAASDKAPPHPARRPESAPAPAEMTVNFPGPVAMVPAALLAD